MSITIRVLGRSIPARDYLAGLGMAKRNPDLMFRHGLHCHSPHTGAEVMAQYRRDLHRRICDRAGGYSVSRVHLAIWAKASTPRVVLEAHDLRAMNRHQRAKMRHRQREE